MRGVGRRVSRTGCGVVRTGGARRTSADWTGTRSALQRACRQRAYGVIQRSRAWGTLIAEHHPRAVRLSIHPPPIGAPKFGIRLLDAPDAWTTPWDSTALHRSDGSWTLMPRVEADRMGRLMQQGGRESHFDQIGTAGPSRVQRGCTDARQERRGCTSLAKVAASSMWTLASRLASIAP